MALKDNRFSSLQQEKLKKDLGAFLTDESLDALFGGATADKNKKKEEDESQDS